jgi:kievitone hydratase
LPSFYISADTTPLYLTNTNGGFNLTFDNGVYALGSTSKTDPITGLRTFSHVPGVEFDITFEISAPALLNAGLGSFFWAGAIQHQWSMPAGRVSGSLIVDNKTLTIDPEASLTWYDRQFGLTAAQNFTWFGLHLNSGKDKPARVFSLWQWIDPVSGNKQFVTERTAPNIDAVVPIVQFLPSKDKLFQSKLTNFTYPLEWSIILLDGTQLEIETLRPDSEYTTQGQRTFYTSVVSVKGSYSGYGAVEILLG